MREIAAQQAGRDLVEYALVSLVIGLGVIASTRAIAAGIGAAFAYVGSTLSSAV
ncbi:MAG TPA: Flp family type IVb pilin [Acidisarcina sp.]